MASLRGSGLRVAIVGGGLIGLSAAWRLAERGATVEVFDCAEPGGASSAAAGMLSIIGETPASAVLARAFGVSRALWPAFASELEATSGRRVHLDETGSLLVAFTEAEERHLQSLAEAHSEARLLSAGETLEFEPALSRDVRAGLLAPQDAQVDNRAVLQALHTALARHGVVHQPEHVLRVEAGGAVRRVVTATRHVQVDHVVVAAGVWTGQILAASGFGHALPPARAVKGQMLAFETGSSGPTIRHVVRGLGAYLVPRQGGRLLVGATSEDAGFDCSVTEAAVTHLLAGAEALLPGLQGAPIAEAWAGLRPSLHEEQLIVGQSQAPGLWIATGHYRNGVLLTPLTADLLASAVAGDIGPRQAGFLEAFSPSTGRIEKSDVLVESPAA